MHYYDVQNSLKFKMADVANANGNLTLFTSPSNISSNTSSNISASISFYPRRHYVVFFSVHDIVRTFESEMMNDKIYG